jgi:hypothetical protein
MCRAVGRIIISKSIASLIKVARWLIAQQKINVYAGLKVRLAMAS